jgi:hypothetical protein
MLASVLGRQQAQHGGLRDAPQHATRSSLLRMPQPVVSRGRALRSAHVTVAAATAAPVKITILGRRLPVSAWACSLRLDTAFDALALLYLWHGLAPCASLAHTTATALRLTTQVTDAIKQYVEEKINKAVHNYAQNIKKIDVTLSARGGDTGTHGAK